MFELRKRTESMSQMLKSSEKLLRLTKYFQQRKAELTMTSTERKILICTKQLVLKNFKKWKK